MLVTTHHIPRGLDRSRYRPTSDVAKPSSIYRSRSHLQSLPFRLYHDLNLNYFWQGVRLANGFSKKVQLLRSDSANVTTCRFFLQKWTIFSSFIELGFWLPVRAGTYMYVRSNWVIVMRSYGIRRTQNCCFLPEDALEPIAPKISVFCCTICQSSRQSFSFVETAPDIPQICGRERYLMTAIGLHTIMTISPTNTVCRILFFAIALSLVIYWLFFITCPSYCFFCLY